MKLVFFWDVCLDLKCLFENACAGNLVDDLCLGLLFDLLFMFGCWVRTFFRFVLLACLESVRGIWFVRRRDFFRSFGSCLFTSWYWNSQKISVLFFFSNSFIKNAFSRLRVRFITVKLLDFQNLFYLLFFQDSSTHLNFENQNLNGWLRLTIFCFSFLQYYLRGIFLWLHIFIAFLNY